MADPFAHINQYRRAGPLVPPPVKKTIYDKINDDRYTIVKPIGEDGYPRCYVARSGKKGIICCKTFWKGKFRFGADRDWTREEVKTHRRMNHPNIVKYHSNTQDEHYVYLMTELYRCGTLSELIHRRKSLTEPEVRYYALQLLGVLEYLKHKRVVHRSLKSSNVFISDDMTLRLGNFGLAGQLSEGENQRHVLWGAPNYTAPEILDNIAHSYESDMWAFGIILYTLLVGIHPFDSESIREIYNKILSVDIRFPHDARISDEAKDIITLILQANPDDRPSFEQVREHPFFKGYTPHTLSSDALHSVPQFTVDTKASLKRSLDCNVLSCPSLNPSPSTLHKKARFGQSPRIVPPVPLPLPTVPNTVHQAEEENHIPTSDKPRCTMYGNILNTFHAVKRLIELGHSTSDIENQIGFLAFFYFQHLVGYADQSIPNFLSKYQPEEKLGYTYEFIDGTKGVVYPDLTTISTSPDLDYVEYKDYSQPGGTSVSQFDKAGFQQAHPEKGSLFRAQIAKLDDISPAIQPTVRDTLLPSTLTKPTALTATVPTRAQLSYTIKIKHTKHAVFICLSDGSVQMILNCEQFILTDEGRNILLINKEGTFIHKHKLVDILFHEAQEVNSEGTVDSVWHELYKRLNLLMDFFTLLQAPSR